MTVEVINAVVMTNTIFDRIVGKTIAKIEFLREDEEPTEDGYYVIFLTFIDGTSMDIRTDNAALFRVEGMELRYPVFRHGKTIEITHR